ncbi:putative disease resistance protein [Camellia lanceoleosa]|uniref:Disease resistance protein n=1 Tax=Camellia lanceoleosa TaxID=1840588 RepID=A0ACC0GJ62_9ERIC|nr:putative disease resistance protein [Camellia lanceoleosa]
MAMAVCDALISSIGGKVVELLVEPVGRQFDYVLNRVKYIKDLQEQVQNLEAQRKDVLDSIDAAKLRNRVEILESVKNWIDKVKKFILEAKKFLEGATNVNQKCFNGWFPDLVTRRRLGKAAKNKAEEAKELGKEGTFNNNISKPAPPLGIESIPSEQLVPYASRDLAMTNVMEALSDDNINFIGIHGIGGFGKTTLVTEIGKKAKSDKLFDNAVMAVVSQNPDIKKIQGQIASWLNFKELNDKENEIERASMLCAKLKEVKKILVILDDVWATLNLADGGIPFGNDHRGCKIIITTRRKQVCETMGNEWEKTKIVWLDVLSEQDSWDLFRKNVGNIVASSTLNDVAIEVCKECGGLPIAVVTVAKAMKATMVLPLFHLEELYLFCITSSSIEYPAVEVVAALRSLPRLKMLTISIPDIAYIPKDFVFPELAQPHDLQLLFNLEELELWDLDSFKGICATSALTTSSWVCYPKLRRLEVFRCPSLSTVLLPFNLLQRLQHLEKLQVSNCEKLEQVFDFGSEGEGMKLSSLKDLYLIKLPRLKHILNCSSRQHVQLCNLRSMKVRLCGKLKYVFQPSTAQALHQLEKLWVRDCEEIEEIVAAKQNEGQQEEERVDYKMVFKSLKELRLRRLPNLSGFCTGGDDFPFE